MERREISKEVRMNIGDYIKLIHEHDVETLDEKIRPKGYVLKITSYNISNGDVRVEDDIDYVSKYYSYEYEYIPKEVAESELYKIMNEID